jgi:hypothetical protein
LIGLKRDFWGKNSWKFVETLTFVKFGKRDIEPASIWYWNTNVCESVNWPYNLT